MDSPQHFFIANVKRQLKVLIKQFLNYKFLNVPEDTYQSIPSVLHLNRVLLGVSSSGEVKHPAKYFGYGMIIHLYMQLLRYQNGYKYGLYVKNKHVTIIYLHM